MRKSMIFIGVIAGLLFAAIYLCTYVVDVRQHALLLQFGEPKGVISESGFHFKLPWQDVTYFDRRLLERDTPGNEFITKDKKSMIIDNYSRWRIVDPLLVFQSARTQQGIAARMDDLVRGKVRDVVGKHTFHEIVSGGEDANLRTSIMLEIRDKANEDAKNLGINIEDVRIKRADLPKENSEAVFQRMKAERQRIAKEYRSEGEEAAKEIRAEADKKREVILAEAYEISQALRGKGDAEATKIYANAYNQDKKFYAFTRSLEAYEDVFKNQATMVITPDTEFFKFFENSTGK